MRLIFIRHGEPNYEKDCLTENGVRQAECTADRLVGENVDASPSGSRWTRRSIPSCLNISEVYASPMGRAKQTASFTAQRLGKDIKVLDFMHEIDWGDAGDTHLGYDGHPWTLAYKLLSGEPGYVGSNDWDSHPFFRDNICMRYYRDISEKIDEFLSGYGLTRSNDMYVTDGCPDTDIALFAHGGSGAVVLSHVLNLPFPFVLTSMPFGVCSVTVIEFVPQEDRIVLPRLELFNDMGHLESVRTERLKFEK